MLGTIRRNTGCCSRRFRDHAELGEEPEDIEVPPTLDDLAVPEPEDVDTGHGHHTVRGRRAHELAPVGSRRRESLDDVIALGDQQVHLAVPVGERGAKHQRRIPKASGIASHALHGRIVGNEVISQVAVHGRRVTLREERLDEVVDDRLVLLCGVHEVIMRGTTDRRYPNFLGYHAEVVAQGEAGLAAEGARPGLASLAEHNGRRRGSRCRSP